MTDRGPVTAGIRLSGDDRTTLIRWAQGGADEVSRRAVRARIVLACAEPGSADGRVAAVVGVSRPTVACWRRRYAQAGLAGLADAQRCGRPTATLELTAAERAQLTRWARQGKTGQALALRAEIVLACAAGIGHRDTAAQLRVSEATVARWRSRFITSRLDGLADRPRPGRPRSIPPQKVEEVIVATRQQTPGHAARWSRASMARRSGLSRSTIGRIWSRSGLRPHLTVEPAPLVPQGADEKKSSSITSGVVLRRAQEITLLAAERRDLLLARLRRDGKLVAKDLAAEFGLSDDSIRRDLRDLAAARLCQRVYGGALPISPILDFTYDERSHIAPDSKRRVAEAAARLITPGSTVILDGGTTAVEVAMVLPPDLEATIITLSPPIAVALASHPKVTVHTLTGQLHKDILTPISVTAAEAALGISADLALLTTASIHPQHGLTIANREDAAMKRILISRAVATYVMASSEKLGTVCAYQVAGLSDVAGIITDTDHPAAQQLRDHGATIIPAI